VPAAPPKPSGGIAECPGKKTLNPNDYKCIGLKGEVKVKPPGSIDGQAFAIQSCEDCDIYVVDHNAQITIDECKHCRIFIGPCEGSIFIRDSVNCKCAFICRQFRTRDCTNCDIALYCRTRPIIESSINMGFACYDLNYEKLAEHMKACRLSVLHNFWSYIYDFTAKPGNWHTLDAGLSTEELLSPIPQEAQQALGKHGAEGLLIRTYGDRKPAPSPDYLFVLFPDKKHDQAMQFANQAKHQATILRSNHASIPPDQGEQMTHLAGWPRSVEREIISGASIGFEISGAGCATMLHSVAHALGGYHTENEEVAAMFRHSGLDG